MYKSILLCLICLFSYRSLLAQGIEFIDENLTLAIEEAAKNDKIIFVDAYTSWCGPCKVMAKKIFPEKVAGDFFNEHFINLKLNMEKGEGIAFMRKYSVQGFPTLLFINSQGKVIHSVLGMRNVEALLAEGKKAVSNYDLSGQYKQAYNKGNRDYDLVYNYVKALNKANKSSSKIANDFLKNQHDISSIDNLKFILLAMTYADSKIFDLLIDNRSAIAAVSSKGDVQGKILNACAATAAKAIDYESIDLLTEAIDKAMKYAPHESEKIIGDWVSNYFGEVNNETEFISFINNLSEEMPHHAKHGLVDISLKQFGSNQSVLEFAEREAKKCCKVKPSNYHYQVSLARVYIEKDEKKKALKTAKQALKLAKKANAPTDEIDQLILTIQEI